VPSADGACVEAIIFTTFELLQPDPVLCRMVTSTRCEG
jgi:hypothetical protein